MEPESSLPHSQEPATCPCPEPARSSPYPHIPLPEDPFQYYLPIYAWVSLVVSLLQVFPPKPCIRLSSPLYMLHAPPISFFSILSPEQYWVRNTDNISSSLCSFLHSLVTSSLFGTTILLNTLFSNILSLPQCQQPSFTPIHNNRQNYGSVYLHL